MALVVASAETTEVEVALIALGGALIGGLISGATQLLAEWIKSRRERTAASERVRGVGRVVHSYLNSWRHLTQTCIDDPRIRWWSPEVEPSQHWDSDDIQMLAATLPREQWVCVREATLAARNMWATRIEALEDGETVADALRDPSNRVEVQIQRLNTACASLEETFGSAL
jgi:hypothetical protein